MADQKKEIIFNRSMLGDKRNPDFAYLRKGIFNSQTPGLYPSKDFVLELPKTLNSSYQLVDILGRSLENFKVIVLVSGGNYKFYEIGSESTSNNDFAGNIIATAYGEGVTNGVYFVDDNVSKVYSINYSNVNIQEVATFPSGPSVNLGKFDGLYYWWAGSQIWKQLPDQTPVLVFDDTGFSGLRFMDFYEDQIIFFTQKQDDIIIYFWDKTDTTLFQKRITIKNSNLIGAGVVGDTLMLVRSIPDLSNEKERSGKLIIEAWNGTSFKELNSLPTGNYNVAISPSLMSGTSCKTNYEYMILSLSNNIDTDKNEDLFKNYVYKIYKDGAIEVLADIEANGTRDYVSVVNIGLGFNILGVRSADTNNIKIYTDEGDNTDWDDYIDYNDATYITNFYCNPFNEHQLDVLNISFEKLFRNGAESSETDEELDIYYRISDRLDWTLLGTVTAQTIIDNVNLRTPNDGTIPLREQRYQITKMPDGSALPRFNEIQFKFLSKKGFSIIGAWFEYSYTTRNKVK